MKMSSSSSSTFNEDNFLKKLDNVTPTQDSIQSLALWIIHHKNHHEIICKSWLKKLIDPSAPPSSKQRLAMFYLANDVIQNCKRKNAKIFQDTYKTVLVEAVTTLASHDSIKKSVERVFDVWLERNVYDKDFITQLNNALNATAVDSPKVNTPPPAPAPAKTQPSTSNNSSETNNTDDNNASFADRLSKAEMEKIIAEFQPKKLCETISSYQSLLNEVSLSKSQVETSRILDINIDHIKQYRDKNQCAKFKVEFENSCLKLEDYISKLQTQASQRKHLLQLLEQSEIFYDAQFKDAKTVFNAYRIFGSKVHTVKRKLDELVSERYSNRSNNNNDKLDNLDMEMSDDDDNNASNNNSGTSKSASIITVVNNSSTLGSSLSNLLSSSNLNRSLSNSNLNTSGTIRTHLDPRQNRNSSSGNKNSVNSSSSSNNNNKKKNYSDSNDSESSQSSSSSSYAPKIDKKRDRSSTPVRDEIHHTSSTSTVSSASKSSINSNSLEFLTKFINKSATAVTSSSTAAVSANPVSSSTSSSSKLSYLVSSLQKFVNNANKTSSTTNGLVSADSLTGQPYAIQNPTPSPFQAVNIPYGAPPPPPASAVPSNASHQFYDPYHPGAYIQTDKVDTGVLQHQHQQPSRSGTPTKDEIYQQPTLIISPMVAGPPPPPPYHHPHHQAYCPPPPPPPPPPQQQYPPPQQAHLGIPSMAHLQPQIPQAQHLIQIDSNNYHPNYMFHNTGGPAPIQLSPHGYHPASAAAQPPPPPSALSLSLPSTHHHYQNKVLISPTSQQQQQAMSSLLTSSSQELSVENNQNNSMSGNNNNDRRNLSIMNKNTNEPFKRKYSNNFEDDYNNPNTTTSNNFYNKHHQHNKNHNHHNHHHQPQQQQQSQTQNTSNRIPTINSQRDRDNISNLNRTISGSSSSNNFNLQSTSNKNNQYRYH